MNVMGSSPEPYQSGFIPLIALAYFLSYNLEINIPEPDPVSECLMQHEPLGRDENGVTIMDHRRPCHGTTD